MKYLAILQYHLNNVIPLFVVSPKILPHKSIKKTVLDWDTKYLIYTFETAQIISQFCPISSLHEQAKHFNIHKTKHHLHQRWVPY